MITIQCPKCKLTKEVERAEYDPEEAVLAHIHCEKCVSGGYSFVSYYDKDGKEII